MSSTWVLVAPLFSVFCFTTFCLGSIDDSSKWAAPDQATLKASSASVREIFHDDLAAAKSPDQKAALAKKLLQSGNEETTDRPGKFALLSLARDLAVEGNDIDGAFAAVSAMQDRYTVDGFQMKADLLPGLVKGASTKDIRKYVAAKAEALGSEAMLADRYEAARQCGDSALAAARLADDPELVRSAIALLKQCRESEAAFSQVKPAVDILARRPTDPEANLKVGRYRCLSCGDWARGLPMLSLGSDASLKTLAEQDLAAPSDADAQVKVGDAWWDLGTKLPANQRVNAQARAAFWYRAALPSVGKGLTHAKVEERIKVAERAQGATGIGKGGSTATEAGTWVSLIDSIDDFQKIWIRGDNRGTVNFDANTKVIQVESPWTVGGFKLSQPWRELAFTVRIQKLAFGNLDLKLGKYTIKLGDVFKKRLPIEAILKVGYDNANKQLFVAAGNQRISAVTVSDDSWRTADKLEITSDGGQPAALLIKEVKLWPETIPGQAGRGKGPAH